MACRPLRSTLSLQDIPLLAAQQHGMSSPAKKEACGGEVGVEFQLLLVISGTWGTSRSWRGWTLQPYCSDCSKASSDAPAIAVLYFSSPSHEQMRLNHQLETLTAGKLLSRRASEEIELSPGEVVGRIHTAASNNGVHDTSAVADCLGGYPKNCRSPCRLWTALWSSQLLYVSRPW